MNLKNKKKAMAYLGTSRPFNPVVHSRTIIRVWDGVGY